MCVCLSGSSGLLCLVLAQGHQTLVSSATGILSNGPRLRGSRGLLNIFAWVGCVRSDESLRVVTRMMAEMPGLLEI
jgi:hypothetical protein